MKRGLIVILFVVFSIGGFFIFQNYSQASLTPITLISHDGTFINNPIWVYQSISTSSAGYLILNSPESILTSPSIIIPTCNTAQLNFLARTYYGAKFNEKTNGTSSDIYIYVKVDGLEELVTVAYNPTTNSSPTSMPEVDFTKYCGKEIYLTFKSPNAVTSSNPTMSKGFGLDEISLMYTPVETNQLPVANAGLDKEGIIDEELEFADGGSSDAEGPIVEWFWNFGSEVKNGSTTHYTFNATGTKSVFLQVLDNSGATSSLDELLVLIKDKPLVVVTSTATTTPTSTELAIYPSDLTINEVLPAPADGDEWLEIYNNTTSTIDLSRFVLLDLRAGKFVSTTLAGNIEGHGFIVIKFATGILNNTGDTLVLETLSGIEIDRVVYPSFSTGNYSWARKVDGVDTDSDSDFALTISPTPGLANIIEAKPTPASYGGGGSSAYKTEAVAILATTTVATTSEQFAHLIINEVLPNPTDADDENEFIEIKNIGTTTVNLFNFYLTDGSNKKYLIKSSSTLAAGGLLTVYSSESKISLNNSGKEIVSIYSPLGKLLNELEYTGNNKENWSYAITEEDEWQWTSRPTPNKNNEFAGADVIVDDPAEKVATKPATIKSVKKSTTNKVVTTVALDEIKNFESGVILKTTGIVATLPGMLGSQYFYLSTLGSTAGVQVYCYKKDFPSLKVGDSIEVIGELSQTNGENRIKIKSRGDIRILESSGEIVPRLVEELSEEDLGSLIKISGEIIEMKGQNLYLDYGSGEAKVYFKAGINLQDLAPKLGEKMEVTGILSGTASGLRILPRSSTDIKIIPGEVKGEFEKSTPSSWPWQKYWPIFAIVGCLGAAWYVGRELLKPKN